MVYKCIECELGDCDKCYHPHHCDCGLKNHFKHNGK